MLAPGEAQPSLGKIATLNGLACEAADRGSHMSYTNLLYHIVYATKERAPLITKTLSPRLHEYLGGTVRDLPREEFIEFCRAVLAHCDRIKES